MVQVAEHGTERREEGAGPPGSVQGPAVNKAIQQLALKYCSESKSSFDELSKIIQVCLLLKTCCITQVAFNVNQVQLAFDSQANPVQFFMPLGQRIREGGGWHIVVSLFVCLASVFNLACKFRFPNRI